MKGINLGEFEELVLLTVGVLYERAYGVAVMDEIKDQTERVVNISAIHTALKRLEEKGYVNSHMGGATNARGGRRKRFFMLTAVGKKTLDYAQEVRMKFYNRIPEIAFAN